MQREGKYPLPAGASKTIMGVEFAGIVTKAGEGAEKFKEGDEVFGLAYGVSQLSSSCILHDKLLMDYRALMRNIFVHLRLCYYLKLKNFLGFRRQLYLKIG